ncbi:MAG: alpha/beta fold hydrolase [Calditrichia bacterium]
MKFKTALLSLIAIPLLFACSGNKQSGEFEGIWLGTLQFPGFESRIAFQIEKSADGQLTAVMLKPDENDDKIPLTRIIMEDERLHFEIDSLKMTFDGEIDARGQTIAGQWRQGQLAQPLTLRRVDKIEKPARPQTPQPPFPYHSKEVSFVNKAGQAVLAGTLTWPEQGTSFPALMLISGGGKHDRDYTIARHKPFWVLADYLARRGIAVLRFDERGAGASTGDRSQATIEDVALDVLAGVEFLKTNPYFKVSKIGLLGHSEGGMIAELAALKSKDVAFIITLGTPGLPGYEYQLQFEETSSRTLGMNERRINVRLGFQREVFDVLLNELDSAVARQKLERLLSFIRPPLPAERKKASLDRFLSPWFRYNLNYDPAAVLQQLNCPVLAIFGEKDLHVPPERNAEAVKAALQAGGNPNYSVLVLPDLNHFFQTNKESIVFNYGKIEETISPKVLELIENWVKRLGK